MCEISTLTFSVSLKRRLSEDRASTEKAHAVYSKDFKWVQKKGKLIATEETKLRILSLIAADIGADAGDVVGIACKCDLEFEYEDDESEVSKRDESKEVIE